MLEKFNNRKQILHTADDVAKSLCGAVNTSRFLRKKLSEEEIEQLLPLLNKYIIRGDSMPFVMLWGAGEKRRASQAEERAVCQLEKLDRTIRRFGLTGMALTIIYADVHGKMNRFPRENIEKYFKSLGDFFQARATFAKHFLRLSDLRNKFGAETGLVEQMRKQSVEYKSHPSFRYIVSNAKLHFQGNDAIEGALEYIAARLLDRRVIKHFFSGYIHLTYNRPSLSFLQPDLLTLYVWSLKKGRSQAPWYCHDRKACL